MRANKLLLVFAAGPFLVCGEDATPVYSSLKAFTLSSSQARADNVVLKRDRIEMRFDGVFYSEAPVQGKVRGAVFQGNGSVQIDPPF